MRDIDINDMPVRSATFWNGYSDGLLGKHSGTTDPDYDSGFGSGKSAARRKRLPIGIAKNTFGGVDWRTFREVDPTRSLVNWTINAASCHGKRPLRHNDPERELHRPSRAAELHQAS